MKDLEPAQGSNVHCRSYCTVNRLCYLIPFRPIVPTLHSIVPCLIGSCYISFSSRYESLSFPLAVPFDEDVYTCSVTSAARLKRENFDKSIQKLKIRNETFLRYAHSTDRNRKGIPPALLLYWSRLASQLLRRELVQNGIGAVPGQARFLLPRFHPVPDAVLIFGKKPAS